MADDSTKKVKILCSFSGRIVPRSVDGVLKYVGGETRLVTIRKDASFAGLMQKMVEVYGGSVVVKYKLPDEDLDALVTVSSVEDFENMMEEYGKMEGTAEGSGKLRVFLFGSGDGEAESISVKESFASACSTQNLKMEGYGDNVAPEGMGFSVRSCSSAFKSGSSSVNMNVNGGLGVKPNQGCSGQLVAPPDAGTYVSRPHSICQTEGFNYVNYAASSGNVHFVNPQHLGLGGVAPVGMVAIARSSYVSGMPITSPPPTPSAQINGLRSVTTRAGDSYVAGNGNGNGTGNGNGKVVPVDLSSKMIQSLSQLPPLPVSSVQASNNGGFAGPTVRHQAPRPPQPVPHAQPVRSEDCLNKAPPLAHSDLLQGHGVGFVGNLLDENPVFHSLQNQGPAVSQATFDSTTTVSLDGISDPKKDGTFISSNSAGRGFTQVPRMQHDSVNVTTKRADNIDQCSPSIPLIAAAFPADLQSLYGLYSSHCSQPVHGVVQHQQIQQQQLSNLDKHGPDQGFFANHPGSDALALGIPHTVEPVLVDVHTNSVIGNIINHVGAEPPIPHKRLLEIPNGGSKVSVVDNRVEAPPFYSSYCDTVPAIESNNLPFPSLNLAYSIVSAVAPNESAPSDYVFCEQDPWDMIQRSQIPSQGPPSAPSVESLTSKDSCPDNHIRSGAEAIIPVHSQEGNKNPVDAPRKDSFPASPDTMKDDHIKETRACPIAATSIQNSSAPHVPGIPLHPTDECTSARSLEIRPIVDNIDQEDASIPNREKNDTVQDQGIINKQLDKSNHGLQIAEGIGNLQIIKNSDLEELRELGSGTFGTVYHGKWRGSDVAIKRISDRCFAGKPSDQERLRTDFWNEASNLSDLHHPNVLAFYGVVLDGPGESVATVTEYMVNGSLRQALQRNDKTFDRRKRHFIAMDVAFAMEYLHGKSIVHFDLKCDNLLVNLKDPNRPICKVGDLGLSKVKRQTLISGGVRGTLPWMAPELLNGNSNRVSEKVDVFSFGIVLWELLTGEEPYADLHYGVIIGGIVSNTLRPLVPESCDPAWRSLMEKCWSAEPSERPSFTEIAGMLRSMASSLP